MYSVAQIKPGVAITLDGEPYIVTKSEFSKQARQGGNNKTTLKNLKTGSNIQRTFSGNDRAEPADLARTKCQYLYKDGSQHHFMHNETYEQFEFTDEDLGDNKYYLIEGGDASVLFYEGSPIGIEVPPKVVLKVAKTIPGVKGDTVQGGTKPADLETGLTVNVPLFINEGDSIRVNTDENSYVERVTN
jgi:elongation factor P